MINNFQAVVFDWDGTLVDSLPFVFSAHNHVRTHFGLPLWSQEEFRGYTKYSSKEIYPKIYGDKLQEALGILEQHYDTQFHAHILPFDGSFDLLYAIKAAGKPMGVVSNMRQKPLEAQTQWFKAAPFFSVIAGSGYAAKDKPDGAPLVKAIGAMGFAPGPQILYVGDTETDLLAGQAAGCTIAYINHSDDVGHPLIQTYKPKIVVNNIKELQTLLFAPGNNHKLSI